MKICSRYLFLFLILLFGRTPYPSSTLAQTGESQPREVIYSFAASLSKAEVLRRQEGGKVFRGKWTADRFRFEGLPGAADIFVSDTAIVDGKARSVIWFPALPGFESSISFSEIPPSKRLYVFFALPDAVLSQKRIIPVDFQIWIGKKRLLNTRVLTKGGRERIFDLTLPYLFHHPYRITFKIYSTDSHPVSFVFYGHTE